MVTYFAEIIDRVLSLSSPILSERSPNSREGFCERGKGEKRERMRRYRNFKRRREERRGYHVRRMVYANDREKNESLRYPSNYISTTRYNPITFLPKNLWEQFHRIANVFFVFSMTLTLIPQVFFNFILCCDLFSKSALILCP